LSKNPPGIDFFGTAGDRTGDIACAFVCIRFCAREPLRSVKPLRHASERLISSPKLSRKTASREKRPGPPRTQALGRNGGRCPPQGCRRLRSAAVSGARERRGCSGNPVCGAGARLLHPSLPSSPQQCRRAGAPIAAARARRAARLALWRGATTRAVARPAPSPAARWWQSEAAGGGNRAHGASEEAPGFKSGCQPGHGRARPRRPGSAQPLAIFALSQRPHGRLVGGRRC